MNIGDQVVVTRDGAIQVVPEGATLERGDQVVGRVVELWDNPDDTVIELPDADANVTPYYATLATVREQYSA